MAQVLQSHVYWEWLLPHSSSIQNDQEMSILLGELVFFSSERQYFIAQPGAIVFNIVLQLSSACFGSPLFCVGGKSMPSKISLAQSWSVCVPVFRILRKGLVIHLHPVDVCKCLAIHFVNEQAALQVVHLVLDDACCPPTGLPHHLLSSGVQPCKEITVWVRTCWTASLSTSSPPSLAPGCSCSQEATSEGNSAPLILLEKVPHVCQLPSSQLSSQL